VRSARHAASFPLIVPHAGDSDGSLAGNFGRRPRLLDCSLVMWKAADEAEHFCFQSGRLRRQSVIKGIPAYGQLSIELVPLNDDRAFKRSFTAGRVAL
jgi:hypothetical protein